MRFLQVPKGLGLWGAIYLTLGIILFLSSLTFFLLNIFFSGLGYMLFTGANIVFNQKDIWFPFVPEINSGGRVGLFLGILGGIICSIIEISLWVSPGRQHKEGEKTTVDKKQLFIVFSILFLVWDVFSTHYFLNGGYFINFSTGILDGVGSALQVFIGSILLFSIGSEMFAIYGLEMLVYNWNEGSRVYFKLFTRIKDFLFKSFGFDLSENDNSNKRNDQNKYVPVQATRLERPNHRPNFSNDNFGDNKKQRGRPLGSKNKNNVIDEMDMEELQMGA